MPTNPLDVLAQQTVAATALDVLDVEEWFETVRRSAPFATLPRSAYTATLDLLSGKISERRIRGVAPESCGTASRERSRGDRALIGWP